MFDMIVNRYNTSWTLNLTTFFLIINLQRNGTVNIPQPIFEETYVSLTLLLIGYVFIGWGVGGHLTFSTLV